LSLEARLARTREHFQSGIRQTAEMRQMAVNAIFGYLAALAEKGKRP